MFLFFSVLPIRINISLCLVLSLVLNISTIHLVAQLPDEFQRVELADGLTNSVGFEFSPDGRIFIVDRYGELLIYKPSQQIIISAGTIEVFHDLEDGFLGIEFDPNFLSNNYIYLSYSPVTPSVNRVSRFTMTGDVLNINSEVVLLEWPTQRNLCCHSAGSMAFDSKGNLYIGVGDNTNHSLYATLNETDSNESSENTSSNTNDLRGKILRITPQANGGYSVPSGNLFPGGIGGLPEIYVMGARNPYKIYVDKENTDWLFWGEVGPDATLSGQHPSPYSKIYIWPSGPIFMSINPVVATGKTEGDNILLLRILPWLSIFTAQIWLVLKSK